MKPRRDFAYSVSRMEKKPPQFPIEEAVPALTSALGASRCAVLSAPPGAGKTTRVPLALLDAAWLGKGKILMLEPRRLAARRGAAYMAQQLSERVGHTVGYRIRGDAVAREGGLARAYQGGLAHARVEHVRHGSHPVLKPVAGDRVSGGAGA